MNVLRLISQLIGIKTLRLTIYIYMSSPLYFISGCKTWIIQILNEFLNVLSLTQPETVKSETPLLFGQSKSKSLGKLL